MNGPAAVSRPFADRLRCAGLTAATVALGLGVHLGGAALPGDVRDVAGDALWAAMIYWLTGVLAPTVSRSRRVAGAAAVCGAVEVSQLLRAPWLVELRATRLGHLVLGSDFDARDLVAYAAGVAGAALVDWVVWRRSTRTAAPGPQHDAGV